MSTTTPEKKRMYYYSVGKRKTAIARVRLFPEGEGEMTVNGRKFKEYFTPLQIENALAPLVLSNQKGQFDIEVVLVGGGKSSQSDALRHGISRGLLLVNPDFRPDLKRAGFLRRDARIKERKKPGLKRARRAPQWQKRESVSMHTPSIHSPSVRTQSVDPAVLLQQASQFDKEGRSHDVMQKLTTILTRCTGVTERQRTQVDQLLEKHSALVRKA